MSECIYKQNLTEQGKCKVTGYFCTYQYESICKSRMIENVNIDLKMCPFCGSSIVRLKHDKKMRDGKMMDCEYVSCKTCGARGSIYFNDPESAIKAWNKMSVK